MTSTKTIKSIKTKELYGFHSRPQIKKSPPQKKFSRGYNLPVKCSQLFFSCTLVLSRSCALLRLASCSARYEMPAPTDELSPEFAVELHATHCTLHASRCPLHAARYPLLRTYALTLFCPYALVHLCSYQRSCALTLFRSFFSFSPFFSFQLFTFYLLIFPFALLL